MMAVAEARRRIVAAMAALPAETVGLDRARGRVLAAPVIARRTQPPADVSAMDGWAVRGADVATVPATLRQIGRSTAGESFAGTVGPGQAVRIFTGATVPAGADCIVIQEDVDADGDAITVREGAPAGTYIRPRGLDFTAGTEGVGAGVELGARNIGLIAAMDVPWIQVTRRPRVALLSSGDELVRPGEPVGPDQIIASNALAVGALVEAAGGEAIDIGIARDSVAAIRDIAAGARRADLLVTMGGASVGEHDLIAEALRPDGLELDFWRIAMRPGKPLMFGRLGEMPLIGLPGNPVSSLVCGLIFVRPAIRALLGAEAPADLPRAEARLGRDLGPNDRRQDYLRARLTGDGDHGRVATPFDKQDSSMLSRLARADCFVIRPPQAPAAPAGAVVPILDLAGLM